MLFCFDRAVSVQRSPQNTIARYYLTIVKWCIYFIPRDPVSSNRLSRIYNGIMSNVILYTILILNNLKSLGTFSIDNSLLI